MIDLHKEFAQYFDAPDINNYLYVLSVLMSRGNIAMDISADFSAIIEEEEYPYKFMGWDASVLATALENKALPFALDGDLLYLRRYKIFEEIIIDKIKILVDKQKSVLGQRVDKIIEHRDLFISAVKEVEIQTIAPYIAYLNNFCIITGGPGTGKTTTLARLLHLYKILEPELSITLCAPTGKAANRMFEALRNNELVKADSSLIEGIDYSTIHSLLGYKGNSVHYKYNADNYLPFDVLIVDETSMVDFALFTKLISALKPDGRLIMLGDKNQLASVEAGSLLADLVNAGMGINKISTSVQEMLESLKLPLPYGIDKTSIGISNIILEYTKSFRVDEGSEIYNFSKAILNYNLTEIDRFYAGKEDLKTIVLDEAYEEQVQTNFLMKYRSIIESEDIVSALNTLNDFKVLCALRKGNFGVEQLNEKAESLLNKAKLIKKREYFYEHMPVMITSNHHDLKIYNGDIGLVRYVEGKKRVCFLNEDGTYRSVIPGLIQSYELAYAMTIHKSQGSEYKEVLIVMPDKAVKEGFLTRELIYTAITRAKQKVIIQSTKDQLAAAASASIQRISGLSKNIRKCF